MPITFFCPNSHKLKVDDAHAGRTLKCPYCNESVTVPAPAPVPHPQSSSGVADPGYSGSTTDPGFFDFGFTRFITNTLISILWQASVIIIFIAHGIAALYGMSLIAQSEEPLFGIIIMVVAVVSLPLDLLLTRISLEVIIVMFRIETHLRTIRDNLTKK